MFCLNLCELAHPDCDIGEIARLIIKRIIAGTENEFGLTFDMPKMIYLGSSFCCQYFVHTDYWQSAASFCSANGIPAVLTLPVFSQNILEQGKRKIDSILSNGGYIDEITVNDFGMLRYIAEKYPDKRINLGRLFLKQPRDIRVEAFYNSVCSLNTLNESIYALGVSGIEVDQTHSKMSFERLFESGYTVGIHVPLCYMTTGNICKFASTDIDIQHKFRPNRNCSVTCVQLSEMYNRDDANNKTLYRIGKTVYYYSVNSVDAENADRLIYFPMREIASGVSVV